jgi:hypothetical protein
MRKLFLAVLCAVCGMAVFGQEPAAGPFDIQDKTLVGYTDGGGRSSYRRESRLSETGCLSVVAALPRSSSPPVLRLSDVMRNAPK